MLFPLFTCIASGICLAGTILFLVHYSHASYLTIECLRKFLAFRDNDVAFLKYYTIGFYVINGLTMAICVFSLFFDWLVIASQHTGKPMHVMCRGTTPPFLVSKLCEK